MSDAREDADADRARALAARGRLAGLVVIVVFLLWMATSWIGGMAGLPVGLALVIDLIALGALVWALASLIGIWRARRDEGR